MDTSEKLIRTLILMVFLILSACSLEMMPRPDPTLQPVQPAPASQPLPPYGSTTSPTNSNCAARPTLTPQVAFPQLKEMDPPRPSAGETVKITGSGGYLFWDDPCQKGYNESSRDFPLYLDGQTAGKINCYGNRCEVRWVVPVGTPPGIHILTTEGGSQLRFDVIYGKTYHQKNQF